MTSTFKVGMTHAEFVLRLERLLAENIAGRALQFVIVPKGVDHDPIGMLGASIQPGGRIELGYQLNPEHWGSGVASAAVAAFLKELEIRPLFARVARHNLASIRVLEKCGFTPVRRETGADGIEELVFELSNHA